MTWQEAFDPCANVRTGSKILKGFYTRAVQAGYRENDAVFAALRGFNSGSVDNPVSNGYAKDILNRVSNVVSVPPASSLARIDVSPGRVVPVTAQAVSDDSSPDMFSKPSGSLFTEAESANVLPSDRPVVVAAVATGAKKEASNGEDDRPLMVQATMSP
jgi:type IV secretion system protein VirB1